ncbi:MAG: ATP-binding protein, partial [Rudaea sp.]
GRADLYALGVMLYELTTGRLPFTGDDPLAVISQHLHAPVVPPRALNPNIPPALESVIVSLLAKRPEDRPASAGEVRRRLEHLDEEPETGVMEMPSLLDRIARGRFVGRQRELAEAQGLWQRACGGEGHVLLVSGEPGIGKTRFVRELTTKVQVSGGRVLTGECYADAAAPYAPIAQLLRDSFDTLRLDPRQFPESTAVGLAAIAPDLRFRWPTLAPSTEQDAQVEQQQVFESAVAWCTALAANGPLLLFVDDTHWADSASLSLLRHLARRTRRLPLLIVVTYREIELDQTRPWNQVLLDLNRERLATRIKLTRLSREETCEMMCALFGEELSSSFVDALYRETEGNPFYIEEVVKGLVEEGKLVVSEGRWTAPNIEEIEIPQSVRLALQSRIGNLSEDAQEVLRLAAILGREFDFETLHRASELSEDALIAALEAAERAQLIEEQHDKNGAVVFSFEHALIRLTLWEGVGSLRRKRLLRRTAEAIAAVHPTDYERIAGHYRTAGDAAQARRYYLQAGERALSVYANEDADRSFRLVLDLDAPADERRRALAGLGESLAPRARHKEAFEAWREAIGLARAAGDWEQVAHLYTRMSRASWGAGDVPGGLALAREGMAAMEGQDETPAFAGLVHEIARACYFNGLPEEGMALATRALEMARRMQAVRVEAESLTTIGVLLQRESRYAEVRSCYEQAIALAEPASLYTTAARAHHNLASILMGMGRFTDAREHARRGVELTGKTGDLFFQTYEMALELNASVLLGDAEDVKRTYERLLEIRSRSAPASEPDLFLT